MNNRIAHGAEGIAGKNGLRFTKNKGEE